MKTTKAQQKAEFMAKINEMMMKGEIASQEELMALYNETVKSTQSTPKPYETIDIDNFNFKKLEVKKVYKLKEHKIFFMLTDCKVDLIFFKLTYQRNYTTNEVKNILVTPLAYCDPRNPVISLHIDDNLYSVENNILKEFLSNAKNHTINSNSNYNIFKSLTILNKVYSYTDDLVKYYLSYQKNKDINE